MLALYRKYRPKTLSEVIGQDQVVKPLSSALKSGKVSHSYLFTGPRGCGKTSVARILAHEINGFKYELEDSYLDIIEIDAASNTGVDNIRELREKAIIAPSEGKYKVYIIDEVHMLTKSAFNALLKTLEEPPAHVVFILATTDLEKVPVTITSRSQVYTFRLASTDTMLKHLESICKKEGIKISKPGLALIAEKGGGSFRDSLSLLDQISSLGSDGKEISESTVADCLGLPMDSKINQLLDAYAKGDAEIISGELKNLLAEGLKPESIASSCLAKIIAHPTPALFPLLGELPKVVAPFPEAKLLLAFLGDLRGSFKAAKENSRLFKGDHEGGQSIAGASRSRPMERGEERSDDSALRSARLVDEKKPTEFSPAKKKPLESHEREDATHKTKSIDPDQNFQPQNIEDIEPPKTEIKPETNEPKEKKSLTPALSQYLKKCKVVDSGDQIDIYPSSNTAKRILEKENNAELLMGYFGKNFVIHGLDELENSPEIQQISDIMGNIQEVNDNGGIPF